VQNQKPVGKRKRSKIVKGVRAVVKQGSYRDSGCRKKKCKEEFSSEIRGWNKAFDRNLKQQK